MWIKRSDRIQLTGDDIARSEIAPRHVFENRRRILQAAGAMALGSLIGVSGEALATYSVPRSEGAEARGENQHQVRRARQDHAVQGHHHL